MKSLFSVKVKTNSQIKYLYYKAYSFERLVIYLKLQEEDLFDWNILQIKRLKRIYRKNIIIRSI